MLRRHAVIAGAVATAATLTCAGSVQAATPAPDLVVTAVDVAPQSVVAGQPVTFRATIRNQGTAATKAGVIHGVGFRVGSATRTWSDNWTSSLAPGQSVTVTATGGPTGPTWPAPSGNTTITAFVDDAKRITESNEANNTLNKTVSAAPSLSARLRGNAVAVVYAAPSNRATGVANLVTGDTYGACYTSDGAVVLGSERFLGTYSAGHTYYDEGGPFTGSGDAYVPASTTPTQVLSNRIEVNEIMKWNYGEPLAMPCPAGASGGWTHITVKQFTSRRYDLTTGALLATATQAVEMDLPMGH